MSELLHLYEAALGKTLDKRNFTRKINNLDIVIALDEKAKNVPYRAPRYYKFNNKNYKKLLKQGINFEI
jgi:8-oxo-dGTP diphosphatase